MTCGVPEAPPANAPELLPDFNAGDAEKINLIFLSQRHMARASAPSSTSPSSGWCPCCG